MHEKRGKKRGSERGSVIKAELVSMMARDKV